MHICKVELENFKSHENSVFDFACGTTSITGENGAGKTSIIEAIAWTVFDTLDYKKEDIIRRGAKKGIVRTTFESGLDERRYTVYRDTGTGYYIYDPQLKARIADKKEEVKRFLWQHLGIEPGTDLESLFKHAIGVPQGTFTAIFLATPADRKRTFDSLLKVEEYRRSSDELLKTARFVDQQIAAVNVKIARAEGEIARIDLIEQELKTAEAQVLEWDAKLEKFTAEADEKQRTVTRFDEIEGKLGELLANAERVRAEAAKAEVVLRHRETELTRSRAAAERVALVRADAEAHQNVLGRLQQLERERAERQGLRDELSITESALNSADADVKHLQQDLARIQNAHSEIALLTELLPEQERLESELASARREQAKAEGALDQLKVIDQRLPGMREAYKAAMQQLADAREKSLRARELDSLQTRDAEIVRELATERAALERDERFQREVKNGLCPVLSQKCLNLREGETLEGFISSQFGDVRIKIDGLVTEQAKVGVELKAARGAAWFNAQISVLEIRVDEIGAEGTRLKEQKGALEAEAEKAARVREDLSRIEQKLASLDNPKAKTSILEKEGRREGEVRKELSLSEKNLERLESGRRFTAEKLEGYKGLDTLFDEAFAVRDRTLEANRIFVANEASASQAEENEVAFAAARDDFDNLARAVADADSAVNETIKGYDRKLHLAERAALMELRRQQTEAEILLGSARKRQSEMAAEAARLYEIRKSMQDEFRERERLQKVAETTDFIRSTLREAAPLVAKNYVHHVSLEANQMFREIGGYAERSLKWTDDYGIVLEEGGYDRPFQSLSGGEQMAAAISVRLALLKQLSDIHIAFFDEPTANMDAERRENLASQIGSISHFDQLFVISHDDTFEGYLDHEIKVGA